MKKFITSTFSLLLLLTVISIHAETTRYNIEIVIFEGTSDRYIDSEQWPIIHHPEEESTMEVITPESDIFPIGKLETAIVDKQAEYPESNSVINVTHHTSDELADHVVRLNKSSRYNVLLHRSWQQTGLSDTDAINIQVDTTKAKNAKNGNVTIFKPGYQTSTSNNQILESSVEGTLKLILGRYLHIHTDLLYKRLNDTYKQTSPALHSKIFSEFKIKAQRRMRSKELHYIDHPLMGILILVSPIKQPEPAKYDDQNLKL